MRAVPPNPIAGLSGFATNAAANLNAAGGPWNPIGQMAPYGSLATFLPLGPSLSGPGVAADWHGSGVVGGIAFSPPLGSMRDVAPGARTAAAASSACCAAILAGQAAGSGPPVSNMTCCDLNSDSCCGTPPPCPTCPPPGPLAGWGGGAGAGAGSGGPLGSGGASSAGAGSPIVAGSGAGRWAIPL